MPRALAAAAFAALLAAPAVADEPKSVDLSDLRDAVKAAAKRGANVGEVTKALDAVEKMLAKDWKAPKADAAPPAELTALRDAVEAVAKRGENVDAIRTELDAVEKASIGRVIVAQKPESKALDIPELGMFPVEPFRRGGFGRGGFDRAPLGRGGIVIVGGGGTSTSVTLANGEFSIKSTQQDGVRYDISGTPAADGLTVAKVVITEGEKKSEYESLEKVPEAHRPTVDRLLKMVRRP